MRTFVVLSFLLMGWAYWVLSGGSGFAPEAWPEVAEVATGEAEAPPVVEITRADASLDDLPLAPAGPEGTDLATLRAPSPSPEPAEPLAPAEALLALAPEMAAPLAPRPETAEAPEAANLEAAAPVAAPDLRAVTGDAVNLREGPGTDFAVVGRMGRGDRAEVLEAADGWMRVRSPAGEGWMAERFLGAAEG